MTSPLDNCTSSVRSAVLEKLEISYLRIDVPRYFSDGAWNWRYQCMIAITTGGHTGWGELTYVRPEEERFALATIARRFKNKTIAEALELCRCMRGTVEDAVPETFEIALWDLSARLAGKNILDFFGLKKFDRIPCLETILLNDPAKAAENARLLARNYLKIKLFGDLASDLEIVRAVRKVIPRNCFLTSDVNLGYLKSETERSLSSQQRLDIITDYMRQLRTAGLNACEDPAHFNFEELEKLQNALPGFPIIPDEPMRPGYRLCEYFRAVPGAIYNLHPHAMGSILSALKLAEMIKQGEANVMIGDNSLVGIGCTQWQLLAGGCGAIWCEAVEKTLERSDEFAACIQASPMKKADDGFSYYTGNSVPGFGILLDQDKLKALSEKHITA